MKLDVHSGPEARQLLYDESYCRQLRGLFETCPWSTVFQSIEFVKTWYEAYADEAEPLVVTGRNGHDEVVGWFPLAVKKADRGRRVVAAGDHHAEYQAWLATETDSGDFIREVFKLLKDRLPHASLALKYLPDNVPRGPFSTNSGPVQFRIHRHRRPLVKIGEFPESALRKKSNKSRINRLGRIGDVRIRHLESPEDFVVALPEIAAAYDLRQGAQNDVCPFQDDPIKFGFHVELARQGDLLQIYLLQAGERIVASVIGAKIGSYFSVGVFSYSPFYAKHSPGKILLMLLARRLQRDGYAGIDLTPGGAWKERFATDHDDVWEVAVYFSNVRYRLDEAREQLLDACRKLLLRIGVSPPRARAYLLESLARLSIRRSIADFRGRRRRKTSILVADLERHREYENTAGLAEGRIAHLLEYRPRGATARRAIFFSRCLDKLQSGARCFTRKDDSGLSVCIWGEDDSSLFPETSHDDQRAGGHELLICRPDEAVPLSEKAEALQSTLESIVALVARSKGVSRIGFVVTEDRNDVRRILEKAGFRELAE